MNYIRHLNGFFARVPADNRLSSAHISLYIALFQHWNYNRFDHVFPVHRDDIMRLSKIGSKNTYHRCIKELHQAGYIRYYPPPARYLPIKVSIRRMDLEQPKEHGNQITLFGPVDAKKLCPKSGTQQVPDLTDTSTENGTVQVPNMGHLIKQVNNINSVLNTPTPEKNKKNRGKKNEKNGAAALEKMPVHVPDLSEIEAFFTEHNYPTDEARKFWYYNNSKGWILGEGIPILNWQSLAHKWMLNPPHTGFKNNGSSPLHTNTDKSYDEPL